MLKKTVFIIGAGASQEIGLPLNKDLKNEISSLLDLPTGNNSIGVLENILMGAMRKISANLESFRDVAKYIRKALTVNISIDNLIYNQRDHSDYNKIVICSKLAICQAIIQAERKSELYKTNSNFIELQRTWFMSFFHLLTENCSLHELKSRFQLVTLIIFNYDRCVEHFLHTALMNSYGISYEDATTELKNLNIIHPYGKVGNLRWQNGTTIEFGGTITSEIIYSIYKDIRTFSEGIDPNSSEILKIRQKIHDANRIVFLGFAYHNINMNLINPDFIIDNWSQGNKTCYGSAYRISKSDQGKISSQIELIFKGRINVTLDDSKCYDFINNYWKSLDFQSIEN